MQEEGGCGRNGKEGMVMRVCTGGVPGTWQLIGSMLDCKFLGGQCGQLAMYPWHPAQCLIHLLKAEGVRF